MKFVQSGDYFANALSSVPMRFLLFILLFANQAFALTEEEVRNLLQTDDLTPLKAEGAAAIDPILDIYAKGNNVVKARAAQALYLIGKKSERARELLMQDIHTEDSQLRLQVQWALGRVSSDDSVVKELLNNMRNDPNPLFRDKAACALAHDQVHLTEKQRVILLEGLVAALEDKKDDVRNIAFLALQIQTGQTHGFDPNAYWWNRRKGLEEWQKWVAEYRRNIYGGEQ